MISITQLEAELKNKWPLDPSETSTKWSIIQRANELITRAGQLRKHSAEEEFFISAYHQFLSEHESLTSDIERGIYNNRYLPIDAAKCLLDLYKQIDHR